MEIAMFLFKTTEFILKLTGSPTFKDILSIKDNEKHTTRLAQTIGRIGDVLTDVEGVLFKEKQPAASDINAYNRLRAAYLDAEDFFDEVETRKKKQEADIKMKEPHHFPSLLKPVKVHEALKEINKDLDAFSQDLKKFGDGLHTSLHTSIESIGTMTTETTSFVNAARIIGRDEDKRNIFHLLSRASVGEGQIPVVSIVGIGGVGKTAVARLVYSDEDQLEVFGFDFKIWVCDSQKFDLKSLLRKILQSINLGDTSLHNLQLEALQSRLKIQIGGNKYLLVLDDVKNESFRHWEELKDMLKLGAEGSRILVTTRSRSVAKVMSSHSMTYELKCLSKEDSWSLFEKTAFTEGSKDENLVQIGMCIVEKCGRVPLAIKAIGSLLRGQDERRWEQVRDNDLARIEDDDNDIISILRVSYDALNSKSKECFRYCALFPKNVPISKEILVNIWMSNVSFKIYRGQDTEDACEEILRTMYNRCFLEEIVTPNKGDDDDTYFRMHDLMLDLAKEVAGAEMFLVDSYVMVDDSGKLTLDENIRHLNLKSTIQTVEQISTPEPNGRRLRTILHYDICTRCNPWEKLLNVDKLMSDFPVLRMLDLQKSRLDILPKSVGKLIHLRYLNLSYNEFHTLPSSIAELWNLQSLLLKSCNNLEELPVGIHKLINLRHLNLEECNALTQMPYGMGALKSICALKVFIVGHHKSKHVAKLEDLGPLSKLQGDLIIKLPEKSTLKEQGGGGAFLLNKKGLRTLKIEWPDSRYNVARELMNLGNDMNILAKLQPHSNLKNFTLYGYEGLRFPPWADDLASLLPNLVSIVIDTSMRCKHLASFSKLGCLKRLSVCNLPSLEYMEEETDPDASIFFPSLEYLWLMGLKKLKGWCRKLVGIANESLEEKSSLLPSLRCLSDLHIYGCPKLEMTSMPASPVGQCNVKVGVDDDLTVTVQEALSSQWGVYPFKSEKDSVASSSSVSLPATFHTHDIRLCISTPWEQYLHGNPISLVIEGFNIFKISPTIMDAAFGRMSKCLTILEIINMAGLPSFPQVLQHLPVLRQLSIRYCYDLTCEDDEHSLQHSTSLENLRCLKLNSLRKLVRLPIDIQSVTSLQMLEVEECPNLLKRSQHLPSLSHLRWLKHLSLTKIPCLEYIQENNSTALSFPSLECILLSSLPRLRDWCRGLGTGVCWSEKQQSLLQLFPSLSRLGIYSPISFFNGKSMLLSSATTFVFEDMNQSLLTPSLPAGSLCCELRTSEARIFKEAIWEQYLLCNPLSVVIDRADIEEKLIQLDLTRISVRLTSLKLIGHHGDLLRTLPTGLKHLTAVLKLSIERFRYFTGEEGSQSDDEMQWGGFKRLTHLEFADLPKMVRLPEWIQLSTALQEVQVCGCNKLVVDEWVNTKFDYVTLPEQQGFRLVTKS